MAPCADVDLHELVNIPRLLAHAGLVADEQAGWAAIHHGLVMVERWTLGLPEGTLPRWVLRGVTITKGDRSITISEDGCRIVRRREATLV